MPERIICWSKLSNGKFLTTTESILTNLENHADTPKDVPPPFPSLVTLRSSYDKYKGLYHDAENGDRVKGKQRNQARKETATHFTNYGKYLLMIGIDTFFLMDVGLIVEPSAKKSVPASASESRPQDVQVTHGNVSRKMVLKCKAHRGAAMLEVQFTEDPSSEENWVRATDLYTKASKMEVSGLQPGKRYYFRVRYLGDNGPGPRSELVNLICM